MIKIFLIRCNVNFESDFAAINNTKNRDNTMTEWKATWPCFIYLFIYNLLQSCQPTLERSTIGIDKTD